MIANMEDGGADRRFAVRLAIAMLTTGSHNLATAGSAM